jgi:uncharacterized protein (DUF488 family)
MSRPELFTIGHSNRALVDFLSALQRHGVSVLADVRSMPHSRRYSHFNRDRLQAALHEHGIKYIFLGDELGARRSEPECYRDGRVDDDLIAAQSAFQAGSTASVRKPNEAASP